MTVENHEIERIFDALTNLDRKLDDTKTGAAVTRTLAEVNASKLEDVVGRTHKLEKRADELDREKAEAKNIEALWVEMNKIRTASQDLTIKAKIVWGLIVAAATVGVEVAIKIMFHIS